MNKRKFTRPSLFLPEYVTIIAAMVIFAWRHTYELGFFQIYRLIRRNRRHQAWL